MREDRPGHASMRQAGASVKEGHTQIYAANVYTGGGEGTVRGRFRGMR